MYFVQKSTTFYGYSQLYNIYIYMGASEKGLHHVAPPRGLFNGESGIPISSILKHLKPHETQFTVIMMIAITS